VIQRFFIDWTQPLLSAVVQLLVDGRPTPVDLNDTIVVVAGRRAGRRFRELLAESTGGRHRPPRIVTIGELPELLYQPKRPFASELVQRLAWIRAIQSLPPDQLDPVVRRVPEPNDTDGWFALAELLWKQHRELAADGLDFADVRRQGSAVDTFGESARWHTLAEIQTAYLRTLDNLDLWDKQTARIFALKHREYVTSQRIVLVGMSDLTRVQREMLDQIAGELTVYVHAPRSLAAAFDSHGCVIPEAWGSTPIPIRDEQLIVADGPSELGGCVAAILGRLGGRYQTDEISIGLADEAAAAIVVRRLHESGTAARWSVGTPLMRTPPVQLAAAVADYLENDRTTEFAALARHSDIGDWLTSRGIGPGWLSRLDDFIQKRAPQRLRDWVEHEDAVGWRRVYQAIDELLRSLRGRPHPLSGWAPHIVDLLRTVYGQSRFDPENPDGQPVISGLEALQTALDEQAGTPADLAPRVPAATAIRLLLRAIAGGTAPPAANGTAVEVMGWLDIAHDDAPATVVVGLNEGLVPQSTSADPFLPDRLRTALGVTDNARRYARDAHALLTLLHSCRDTVLVAGRRDARGDPLAPSRLLLATEGEQMARRVRAFYRPEHPAPVLEPPPAARSGRSGFVIPRPHPEPRIPNVLAVTAFRDYLASPYRFYLKHVEKLREVDDAIDELSAAAFGNLAHTVLGRFGNSPIKDSQDTAEIAAFLSATLDTVAREDYGDSPVMAVEIQLEQARARLTAFAAWQADWARQGWRIAFTESPAGYEGVPLRLPDGTTIHVVGRIDRIDRHADGRWFIFDYKTGDSSTTPEKAHRRDGEWIDLQLPLYLHIAKSLGVAGDVQLGYLRLPRDTSDIGAEPAGWSAEDLAAADEAIFNVAMKIRSGEFWEELPEEPAVLSEYGPICQDGVTDREVVV
jgi:hypothetical protein